MKERPILFSGSMVRAILDGSKTQTRRIAKGVISRHARTGEALFALDSAGPRVACPYGLPGDRLWVRETWQAWRKTSYEYEEWEICGGPPSQMLDQYGQPSLEFQATSQSSGPWRPSIHMPHWASRIDLLIKSVRVERLQDISEADAKSEGADCLIMDNCTEAERALLDMPLMENGNPYRNGFALLWEASYGAGSWEANPWVWVIGFERIKP